MRIDRPAAQAEDDFERRFGRFGDVEYRGLVAGISEFPLNVKLVTESGAGPGFWTFTGTVDTERPLLRLGVLREYLDPLALRGVEAVLLYGHSAGWLLASTEKKTLELKPEPLGLHMWARIAPTGYGESFRFLIERADGDRNSVGLVFRATRDEWQLDEADGQPVVVRTITAVEDFALVIEGVPAVYRHPDLEAVRTRVLGHRSELGAALERAERFAAAERELREHAEAV
jgi:phage head maturation protease